jgi:dihydroorotate dehydrogenase
MGIMAFRHTVIRTIYTQVLKRVFFLLDPETVHARATSLGALLGASGFTRRILSLIFKESYPSLAISVGGVLFETPVGLAAGFDYEARLPQVLPSLGFGFGTVGTLTHQPYEGNPRPMLGRLPRSKSLMVNKGFKNDGVAATLSRWRNVTFSYPVGVSIGKTNNPKIVTQAEGVADVLAGFRDAEHSQVPFAYYELNISCPNLSGSVEFYDPIHLEELLLALSTLNLSRPVFVKMPIAKTDREIEGILDVLVRHPFITGVIFGNLQRDRNNQMLVREEVERFPKGNFSGLPCQERSDELIRLAYLRHGRRLKIIGCGGVFHATDAYRKITLGASLVQLITGLIFEGPQLVAQINEGLQEMLEWDGYHNLAEAVGVAATTNSSSVSPPLPV